MSSSRPRVLLVVGYFDWFSGYQETALAEAFSKLADTEVVASDRVSPAFSDDHLHRLKLNRRYPVGSREEGGVTVTRLPSWERRSMVWSSHARRYIGSRRCDLVVQVMPGQLLPVAPTLTRHPAPRVALYGDQRAMWAELPPLHRVAKGAVFAVTKGVAYAAVNSRCVRVFGYTPDTLHRLRPLQAGKRMELMPLAYSSERFFFDHGLRRTTRERLGYAEKDVVILAAGKIERRKRLDWLIEAFEACAGDQPHLRLLFVGADASDAAQEIVRRAATSPYRDRIQLRGFADAAELNATFNASDVAVWPKNPAITIQQAMGTGLFVVLPRNDLVGHLVRPGEATGHYYLPQAGSEVVSLAHVLASSVRGTDFSPSGRRLRVDANDWLRADTIAAELLSTVGHSC